jgi:hypothetical protein
LKKKIHIPHHPLFTYRYMYKYHSGKSCDYSQAGSFKCVDHLESPSSSFGIQLSTHWMITNKWQILSSANKENILWIRKNNYIIFWLWNVYYYNIRSGKNKYYAEEIYIHNTNDLKIDLKLTWKYMIVYIFFTTQ